MKKQLACFVYPILLLLAMTSCGSERDLIDAVEEALHESNIKCFVTASVKNEAGELMGAVPVEMTANKYNLDDYSNTGTTFEQTLTTSVLSGDVQWGNFSYELSENEEIEVRFEVDTHIDDVRYRGEDFIRFYRSDAPEAHKSVTITLFPEAAE